VFANAMQFNKIRSPLWVYASKMRRLFDQQLAAVAERIAKLEP